MKKVPVPRPMDVDTAWRCVMACAKYLRERDESTKAAKDLVEAVKTIAAHHWSL